MNHYLLNKRTSLLMGLLLNAESMRKIRLKDFSSPGKITTYMPAGGPGVRVDSAVYPEYQIPPYYDSMVAKLISYGRNREEAIQTMKRALEEFVVEGVHTTIPFHALIMDHDVFKSSDFNTDFLKEHPIELDN